MSTSQLHKFIQAAVLLLFCISYANCYNILGIFIHPGRSHFDMFHPLMRGLSEQGHNVTVISHFPDKKAPPNYKDISIELKDDLNLNNGVDLKWFETFIPFKHYFEIGFLAEWGHGSCEAALTSPNLKKFLKTNKQQFDLIILEQFNSDCPVGIAYKFNAPFIALSSCPMMSWHYSRVGMPHIPSFMPVLFSGNSETMSFWGRLQNWFTIHTHNFLYDFLMTKKTNDMLRKYLGDDIPDVSELVKETSLIMVNQHFSLNGPKPLPPSVIEVGGIHIGKQKPLPTDLQELLESAEHGVIVISWGSMIRAESMPDSRRDALLKALSQLKQRVIWKWENSTLLNQPPNVFIKSWLPQRDLLCHPKVRVFMSHGGLLGSSEAAYCGVPVVVTPQYGDQFVNAAALERRGMGAILSFHEMTTENILEAINKVLSPSYKSSAEAVSYSFANRPNAPLETAIWWAEYVAATKGGKLTKSHAVFLPWYIYYSLDVWVFTIVTIALLLYLTKLLVKRVFRGKVNKIDDKKVQ